MAGKRTKPYNQRTPAKEDWIENVQDSLLQITYTTEWRTLSTLVHYYYYYYYLVWQAFNESYFFFVAKKSAAAAD